MSKKTRKEYLAAVQCLQKKPPIYPKSEVPGGRSRFDDFSVTHINQAPYVHFDVSISKTLPQGLVGVFTKSLTRVYFSISTATSSGYTSKLSATSVATPAPSHTGIGRSTTKTRANLPSLMARPTLWGATAYPSHTASSTSALSV